jgi:hypothetical protein
MAGYYKGVQSAGNAISYGMDAVKVGSLLIFPHISSFYYHYTIISISPRALLTISILQTPFLTEFIVSWGLLLISMPLSFWVIWKVRKEADQDVEIVVATDDVDLGAALTPTDKDQTAVNEGNAPAGSAEKEMAK